MVIVSIALRVPPEEQDAFRPVVEALVKSSRAEPGVIAYSFAVDMVDPSVIRIFEAYKDQAALDAHMASAHFLEWRPKSAAYPREDRLILEATGRS